MNSKLLATAVEKARRSNSGLPYSGAFERFMDDTRANQMRFDMLTSTLATADYERVDTERRQDA